MDALRSQVTESNWMMGLLQSIDVGLIVIDRDYRIQTWNSFMENHSGRHSAQVIGNRILDLYQDIPANWFMHKIESVVLLKGRAFSSWEQRPFLIKFKNPRPLTGLAEYMYQNITLLIATGILLFISVRQGKQKTQPPTAYSALLYLMLRT